MDIRLISQRAYPIRKSKSEYISSVENIMNKDVRIALKLILSSGFRICEIINSYIYRDDEGKLIIRGIAEKSRKITDFVMPNRKFLGEKRLNSLVSDGSKAFKSVPLMNIFELDMFEIEELVSPSAFEPYWYGKSMRYYTHIFRNLKKEALGIPIQYKVSKLDVPIKTGLVPSFHFYRKLFSSELVNVLGRESKVVDYMKWQDAKMLFIYVKNY